MFTESMGLCGKELVNNSISVAVLFFLFAVPISAQAQRGADDRKVIEQTCTLHGNLAEDLYKNKMQNFERPEVFKGTGVGQTLANYTVSYAYENATSLSDAYRISFAQCENAYNKIISIANKKLAQLMVHKAAAAELSGEGTANTNYNLAMQDIAIRKQLIYSNLSVRRANEKLARTIENIYLNSTLKKIEKELSNSALTKTLSTELSRDRDRCVSEINNSKKNSKLELGRRQWAKKCEGV